MAAISDLISEVWRETGRHIEIQAATAAITAAVERVVPLRGIVVFAVGPGGRTVEPLAVGLVRENDPLAFRTHEVSPGAAASLGEWLAEGSIVMTGGSGDSGHAWLTACLPAEIGGDLIAGPLRPDRLDGKTAAAAARAPHRAGRPAGSVDASGILVLLPVTGKPLTADHAAVAEKLLEPFAVALGNDTRLHELLSLREAAEADRQTLLTRLGKQDVNEDVIGGRTGLKHVMERVELVAQSDVPVLILGDTGTGKEVVSRAIHTRSKRSEGPFIRVNCGAIPPELIDSQLFGHEKGSFTGASEQHKGWFERADRGTLFLDEIGELPLPAQVRLLRVLQDHQIERVGGRSPVRVDVRIVAATHRDLSAMVRERTFREDLWYRVNVFPILLPPLRERVEDIPALVRHFAQRAAGRFGLPAVAPSDADIKLLSAYDWPGNIRELGAVIDRAVILGGGRSLDVAVALGLSRQQRPAPVPPADATLYEVIPESIPLDGQPTSIGLGDIVPLATAMRQHIERALAATEGRIEGKRGAAALLEINPHTLRARMRKLGIDPDRFRS